MSITDNAKLLADAREEVEKRREELIRSYGSLASVFLQCQYYDMAKQAMDVIDALKKIKYI